MYVLGNVYWKYVLQGNKVRRDGRDKERYERRILDELMKMFNDSDSFYYSREADLTSSLQRQSDPSYGASLPIWCRANDNFFWNKHMLMDLINQEVRKFYFCAFWTFYTWIFLIHQSI